MAAGDLPKSQNRLVNDYAGVLTHRQQQRLELRLEKFSDSTSNQIVVIYTPSLEGYDIMDYARRIGDSWGVGQSDFKNGLVIVVKVRNETDGEVAIATGYGLEGALPDIACNHIINEVMIPRLSEKEYYSAVVEALDIIEPIAAGEYTYSDLQRRERREMLIGLMVCGVMFLAVALFLVIAARKNRKGPHDDLDWGCDDEPGQGRRNSHGLWGIGPGFYGGSMGGSGFGGGGFGSGGFGGFGGGSFGGGGAHGKF
ncbi:MAG: TPM domain-containing protein [Bacteroidales bacterium]|nr:TPM domain-containing protein [Bacteroidales bacterium]